MGLAEWRWPPWWHITETDRQKSDHIRRASDPVPVQLYEKIRSRTEHRRIDILIRKCSHFDKNPISMIVQGPYLVCLLCESSYYFNSQNVGL